MGVDDAVGVEDCVGEAVSEGLREAVSVCDCDLNMSAMRILLTVMEAIPASLSSQAKYTETSAPLEKPLPGLTLETFARRKHGAAPLPLMSPMENWNEYAVQSGHAAQHAARQAASVVTSSTVPGAFTGPTRAPDRSMRGRLRKSVELHDDAGGCNARNKRELERVQQKEG